MAPLLWLNVPRRYHGRGVGLTRQTRDGASCRGSVPCAAVHRHAPERDGGGVARERATTSTFLLTVSVHDVPPLRVVNVPAVMVRLFGTTSAPMADMVPS